MKQVENLPPGKNLSAEAYHPRSLRHAREGRAKRMEVGTNAKSGRRACVWMAAEPGQLFPVEPTARQSRQSLLAHLESLKKENKELNARLLELLNQSAY